MSSEQSLKLETCAQVNTDQLCSVIRNLKMRDGMSVQWCPLCGCLGVKNQQARHRKTKKCRTAAIPLEIAALEAKIAALRAEERQLNSK